MKTLITSILIVALTLPVLAQEKEKRKTEPRAEQSWAIAALVLSVAAVGAIVVVKVFNKHGQPDTNVPVDVVLEKSKDHVNWIPVLTNRVVLNGVDPSELFQETRKDGSCFYRARVQKVVLP